MSKREHTARAMSTQTANPRRIPLPMSSGVQLLPGQRVEISGRSQLDAFCPEDLLIKHASRWSVYEIAIEGRESLTGANIVDQVHTIDAIPPGRKLTLGVTYVGPHEQGEPFEACIFGTETNCRPEVTPILRSVTTATATVTVDARSRVRCQPLGRYRVDLPPRETGTELWPEHLTLKDASSWIVHDILVRGRSINLQAGDLPGEMFLDARRLSVGRLAHDDKFEVVATYVGDEKDGAELVYRLSGHPHAPGRPADACGFLPISTGVKILPNTSAQITARPWGKLSEDDGGLLPGQSFQAREIVLADADDWVINDLVVGVHRQFAQCGDIPGSAFSPGEPKGHVVLDPCLPGVDFVMVVTYVGDKEQGAEFVCGVAGDILGPTP